METVLVSEVHAPGCRQVFCFLDRMAGLAARAGVRLGDEPAVGAGP